MGTVPAPRIQTTHVIVAMGSSTARTMVNVIGRVSRQRRIAVWIAVKRPGGGSRYSPLQISRLSYDIVLARSACLFSFFDGRFHAYFISFIS